MPPNQPTYTLIWNQVFPNWPVTVFKWLLVAVGVGCGVASFVMGFGEGLTFAYSGPIMFAGLYSLQWAKKISSLAKSMDPELPRRVDFYRRLQHHAWAPTASRMMGEWLFVREDRRMLANPLTWGRKQRVLEGSDGSLFITLYEHHGVVGKVKLNLIDRVEPQEPEAVVDILRDFRGP